MLLNYECVAMVLFLTKMFHIFQLLLLPPILDRLKLSRLNDYNMKTAHHKYSEKLNTKTKINFFCWFKFLNFANSCFNTMCTRFFMNIKLFLMNSKDTKTDVWFYYLLQLRLAKRTWMKKIFRIQTDTRQSPDITYQFFNKKYIYKQ